MNTPHYTKADCLWHVKENNSIQNYMANKDDEAPVAEMLDIVAESRVLAGSPTGEHYDEQKPYGGF